MGGSARLPLSQAVLLAGPGRPSKAGGAGGGRASVLCTRLPDLVCSGSSLFL